MNDLTQVRQGHILPEEGEDAQDPQRGAGAGPGGQSITAVRSL